MRLFRRRPQDPELDTELRYHFDQLVAQYVREGHSSGEARRRAALDFGGIEPTKEALRDRRWLEPLRRLLADLHYAFRQLRAAPAFAAVAILSLALGIGANTALFSILNTTLLRLIPVERPEELAWLRVDASDGGGYRLNYPFYQSLVAERRFGEVICAYPTTASVSGASGAQRLEVELVSGNYFSVLGLKPWRGRLIEPRDDLHRLAHPVVVVSHAYWQSHLAESAQAVGQALRINSVIYTIIGITPPGFLGTDAGFERSLFVPIQMKAAITPGWDGLDKPIVSWLPILARLPVNANREALSHQLHTRYHAFQKPFLDADTRLVPGQKEYFRHWQLRFEPLRDAVLDRQVRDHLRTLGFVVLALLLLACANVAGLLLARGLDRQREIATRLALGASRARIIGQLLTESLLIALAGGTAGLLLGSWCAPLIAAQFPLAGEGSRFDVRLDPTVFVFAFAVSLIACLAFGLFPALQSTRLDLVSAIKGSASTRDRRLGRHALLAVQIAIALVLLTMAGVFSRKLSALVASDVGFARRQLLIAEIEPALLNYDGPARIALYRRLEAKLQQSTGGGFTDAALSNVSPMSSFNWSTLFIVDGKPREVIPRANEVGPGYFRTMGIALRRGRLLDERDDAGAPRVAVISETTARLAFPEGDALGRRFMADPREPQKSIFEIVGIVADIELNDPRRREREMVYFPYRQWPFPAQALAIQVRLTSPASATQALGTIRRLVAEIDPQLPLYNIRTIEQALDSLLAAERLAAQLGGFFALLAALLAAIGLYGILAREVSTRRKEIGIRLALGATVRRILWPLLRQSLAWSALGLAAGTAILTAVGYWDSTIVPVALLMLSSVATVAALLPGRRAARVDPAAALRAD